MIQTDNNTAPNPTTTPSIFLVGLQNSYSKLGGIGVLKWPMTTEELLHTLKILQFHANKRVLEVLWGGLQETWTPDDVHRLGVLLDRNGFWAKFPSVHDARKPVSLMAMEVAEYLRRCTPEARCTSIASYDPVKLLTILAGAIDSEAQETLLEAACLKFNCLPVASEQ